MPEPSVIVVVDRWTRRLAQSTPWNTLAFRSGRVRGRPDAIIRPPPTRNSHSDPTIRSGASA